MPDLPFDPPKDAPRRDPAAVAASEHERATQRYTHRDILAMYPSLRLDHLRYLEKCGLVKPLIAGNERFYGFADLTVLRQIAGELQQGSAVPGRRQDAAVVADRPADIRFPSRRASGAHHRAQAAKAAAA